MFDCFFVFFASSALPFPLCGDPAPKPRVSLSSVFVLGSAPRVKDALVPPVLILDNESRPAGVGDFKARIGNSRSPFFPPLLSSLLRYPPPSCPPSVLLSPWWFVQYCLCLLCLFAFFSDRVLHTCTFPVAVGFVVIYRLLLSLLFDGRMLFGRYFLLNFGMDIRKPFGKYYFFSCKLYQESVYILV